MLLYKRLDRHQKLHPDQDIPSDLFRVFDHLIIFTVYNMRKTLHVRHDLDFIRKILDNILKERCHGLFIHSVPVKSSL